MLRQRKRIKLSKERRTKPESTKKTIIYENRKERRKLTRAQRRRKKRRRLAVKTIESSEFNPPKLRRKKTWKAIRFLPFGFDSIFIRNDFNTETENATSSKPQIFCCKLLGAVERAMKSEVLRKLKDMDYQVTRRIGGDQKRQQFTL